MNEYVSGPALLKLMKTPRSIRWLNYQVSKGLVPSEKVGSARVYRPKDALPAIERICQK